MCVQMDIFTPAREDVDWMQAQRTAGGREFQSFVSSLDCWFRSGHEECTVQEIADFRRTVCYGLSKNPRLFQLPSPLPKFIAVVNLSGFKGTFYANNEALIRLLVMTGQEVKQQVVVNVEKILEFARMTNMSLLLCLSLPWQHGLLSMAWEIRTIRRCEKTGDIIDGEMAYGMTFDEGPRPVSPSNATMHPDLDILKAQLQDFIEHLPTTCLDITNAPDAVVGSASPEQKCARLAALVDGLQKDRQKLVEELREAKRNHEAQLTEETRRADERVGKVIDATKKTDTLMKKRSTEQEKVNSTLTEQIKSLNEKIRTLNASNAEQELLHATELTKIKNESKLNAAASKNAEGRVAELKGIYERERNRTLIEHERSINDLERRFNGKVAAERIAMQRANELRDAQRRLEGVVDQLRAEKQACAYSELRAKADLQRTRCMLSVALLAHKTMRTRQNETAPKEVHCSTPTAGVGTPPLEAVSTTASTGTTPEASDACVNTEPMQDSQELCDLRAQVGTLHEQLEARSNEVIELRREVSKLKKKKPPDSFLAESTDVSPDKQVSVNDKFAPLDAPTMDTAMETIVDQTASGLRALVSAARQGASHRRNAEMLFLELSAYKNVWAQTQQAHALDMSAMGMYAPRMQQMQPVQSVQQVQQW